MSNPTRYTRTAQGPNGAGAQDDATPPGETTSDERKSPAVDSAATEAQYQALIKRMDDLRERRMRRQIELERAIKDIDACVTQAKGMGVETLEELEALVARQQAEDEEALRTFEAALNAEEELLDSVDRRLSETQDA
jgi:hypothetical protein